MSTSAQEILQTVAAREGLPREGWEHYFTSVGDDGVSTFAYDRDPDDEHGPAGLVVRVTTAGPEVDRERSWLDCLR